MCNECIMSAMIYRCGRWKLKNHLKPGTEMFKVQCKTTKMEGLIGCIAKRKDKQTK